MCFKWELEIHREKDCPLRNPPRFKLSTNQDTYQVNTISDLIKIIRQDLKTCPK